MITHNDNNDHTTVDKKLAINNHTKIKEVFLY